MKLLFSFAIVLLTLTSCLNEDLDSVTWEESAFEPISSLQPYEAVAPAYDFDYWELVWHAGEKGEEFVHFRNGSICKDANDPMQCSFQFYYMDRSGAGFDNGSKEPTSSYYFLRSNEQGYNKYWYTREELSVFLGAIDSKGDALLVAASNGYFFGKHDIKASGIRKHQNGYQIICLKTVSNCAPLQINRVLVEVDQNARLTVLDEDVYLREDQACNEH